MIEHRLWRAGLLPGYWPTWADVALLMEFTNG